MSNTLGRAVEQLAEYCHCQTNKKSAVKIKVPRTCSLFSDSLSFQQNHNTTKLRKQILKTIAGTHVEDWILYVVKLLGNVYQ